LKDAVARAALLEDAQAAIEEKDQRITALESVEAQLKDAVARAAQLEDAQAALVEKDQRIAALESVEAQLKDAMARAAQLEDAQAAIEEKDRRIAALESVEGQLKEALDRAAQLDAAQASLAEKDRLIEEHSGEAARLVAETTALHARVDAAEEVRSKAELEKKMLLGQVEGLNMQASETAELRSRITKLEAELAGERASALRARVQAQTQPRAPEAALRADAQSAPPRRMRSIEDSFKEDPVLQPPPAPRREKAKGPHDVAAVVNRNRGRGPRRQVGEILVDAGIMTQEQFEESIRMQAADPRKRIGQIIVERGYATEEVIAATLAAQLRTRFADNIEREMTAEALRMVPQNVAVNHRCVPLSYDSGQLTVAMANPLDLIAIEDLQHATGAYIEIVVATPSAIERVVNKYYLKISAK
jgi:hypothetical protein